MENDWLFYRFVNFNSSNFRIKQHPAQQEPHQNTDLTGHMDMNLLQGRTTQLDMTLTIQKETSICTAGDQVICPETHT